MEINISLLKEICETPGTSGFEHEIRELVLREVTPLVDEVSIDSIGNIIAFKKGASKAPKKLMYAAHMDEIGFIVNSIDEKGFIRFYPIGGFDPKALTSQRVIIHGKKKINGVLGSQPVHIMTEEDRKKPIKIKDFFIDTGMNKKDLEEIVTIGDPITRHRTLFEMGGSITCKSLDNRVSVFCLIEALRKIEKHEYDLYATFTTQEEVGLRGAQVASQRIRPDFGIAIDTGIANDTPGNNDPDKLTKLGDGVGIKIMDRAVICDSRLVSFMKNLADKKNLKWQPEVKNVGGTDTAALQIFGMSIAGALSIPTRYLHQTIETISKEDINTTISMIRTITEEIDKINL